MDVGGKEDKLQLLKSSLRNESDARGMSIIRHEKFSSRNMAPAHDAMYRFYFEDPKDFPVGRELSGTEIRYFYLVSEVGSITAAREVLNGCLISGEATLMYDECEHELNQFDMFFIPPEKKFLIKPKSNLERRICLVSSPSEREVDADFEIRKFAPEKFVPRGEMGSSRRVATYRTIWTAIKNGFFMSGFTNIPNEALRQGVLTSVNLDRNGEGEYEIHPHVHPDIPEIYIYCISDKRVAVTQYLIEAQGVSVCKDLRDGDGAFFPGHLGHANFTRPTYKNLEYCMYMWIMPTYGRSENVEPITLRV